MKAFLLSLLLVGIVRCEMKHEVRPWSFFVSLRWWHVKEYWTFCWSVLFSILYWIQELLVILNTCPRYLTIILSVLDNAIVIIVVILALNFDPLDHHLLRLEWNNKYTVNNTEVEKTIMITEGIPFLTTNIKIFCVKYLRFCQVSFSAEDIPTC